MLGLQPAQYLPPVPLALVDICRVRRRYAQRDVSISAQYDQRRSWELRLHVKQKL